jgi:hypothetical protein
VYISPNKLQARDDYYVRIESFSCGSRTYRFLGSTKPSPLSFYNLLLMRRLLQNTCACMQMQPDEFSLKIQWAPCKLSCYRNEQELSAKCHDLSRELIILSTTTQKDNGLFHCQR